MMAEGRRIGCGAEGPGCCHRSHRLVVSDPVAAGGKAPLRGPNRGRAGDRFDAVNTFLADRVSRTLADVAGTLAGLGESGAILVTGDQRGSQAIPCYPSTWVPYLITPVHCRVRRIRVEA